MSDELSFNKKINLVKLLLSSLFARKHDYVVVNGRKPGRVFYTTIPADRAMFFKPDIDDQLASVEWSEKASKIIYEAFPLFKETIAIIHLPKFLAMMNKQLAAKKGVYPVPRVNADTGDITFDIPEGTDIEKLFKTPKDRARFFRPPNGHLVGQLITEDNFAGYEAIFNQFVNFNPEPIDMNITIAEAFANDPVVMVDVDVPNRTHNCSVGFRLPIQDGTNIVSFKEYLSKKKVPWTYPIRIQYKEDQSVAKISCCYRDDLVDVVSITPGSLWFPFRKK